MSKNKRDVVIVDWYKLSLIILGLITGSIIAVVLIIFLTG
jgi:hypothetical protein